MDPSVVTIVLFLLALWLATLSWIWLKHVSDDKERHSQTADHVRETDARLGRTLGRLTEAVEGMQKYQTDFNLKVHGELTAIKALLERNT